MKEMKGKISKDRSENNRFNKIGVHLIESKFWILLGIILNLITYISLFFIYEFQIGYEGTIQAVALAVIYSIIGITLWAIIRFYLGYRYLSLGFLIGGIITFVAIYFLPSSR